MTSMTRPLLEGTLSLDRGALGGLSAQLYLTRGSSQV